MMVAASASPSTPASSATEGTASVRTRCAGGRPSHSRTTTLSVASTPNPAPVTSVWPAATASSCRPSTADAAMWSLLRST